MMVNPLFILVLLFVYSNGESCGSEPCRDLMTAKACDKVDYCITNDWIHQRPIRNESDSVCEICLKMVKAARDQLESNVTLDLLKQVFEGSCSLLVLKPIVKECDRLVDQFAPELVAILASQMDPQTVCGVSKLCRNNAAKSVPPCTRCQELMFAANNLLNVLPREKVKSRFFKLCRDFGSYSEACYQFLSKYGDDMYDEAIRALENKPCEALNICPRDSLLSLVPEKRVFSGETFCRHCVPTVEILKNEFASLPLETESFCGLFPRYEKLCVAFFRAENNGMLTRFLDARDFCSSEVCSEGIPIWPLLPASAPSSQKLDDSEIYDWVQVLTGPQEVRRPTIALGDPIETPILWKTGDSRNDCTACQDMFSTLSGYLAADDGYLKPKLTALCKSDDCKKFVEEEFQYFKGTILNFTDPSQVCPELVYPCSPASQVSTAVSRERSCNFCLKTFQSLSAAFRLSNVAENLRERFVASCDGRLVNKRETCKEVMQNLVASAVDSIGKEFNENETCTRLELCSEPPKPSTTAEVAPKEVKGSCQVCMMIIQTLYDELEDKKSEDEIRSALEKLCRKMPHMMRDGCINLVVNYSEEIVRLITQSASPAEVCRSLGFCLKAEKVVHPQRLLGRRGETDFLKKRVSCKMCQTMMKMMIQELEDPHNEEQIRKLLDKICNYFPEETRDTCRNLIDQYAEDVVDMLIADFNATEVCLYLKLCPANFTEVAATAAHTFDVNTNEVRDAPAGNCEFCRMLEHSLKTPGNENKAAEGLLALLVETCMLDTTKSHLGCARKMSEKILPRGVEAIFNLTNICDEFMICPEERQEPKGLDLLERIHSAVQECAMCEALVEIVTTHEEMQTKSYNFAGHAAHICTSVPRHKQKECKSMLISYGPSIVNLYVDQKVDRNQICFHLKLCDESLQTRVSMPVSDTDQSGIQTPSDCMKGPSFWCASRDNAKQCGTLLHCQETVWLDGKPPM